MRARPPNRPAGAATMRRTRPVKRASAGLSPVRAGAALAMLLCAFAIYGVAASPAFEFDELRIEGATYTDPDAVQGILEEARGENLFRLSTAPLAAALRQLPTVADARIGLGLPGTVTVTLRERQPVLVWKVGSQRYLVDRDGLIVGQLGDDAPPEAAQLPSVVDERASSASLADGQPARPGRRRCGHAPRVAEPRPDRELRPQAGSGGHRRPRLRAPGAARGLDRDLRLLHAEPPAPGHHPRPGAPARPPARGPRGIGRVGRAGRRARRDVRRAAEPVADEAKPE